MTEIVKIKPQDVIQEDLMDHVLANTALSDEVLGSVIDTLTDAGARVLYADHFATWKIAQNIYRKRATRSYLDKHGANWRVTRHAAQGSLTLLRLESSPASGFTLPIGAVFTAQATQARGALRFVTLNSSPVVVPSMDYTDVIAQCESVGEVGNILAGSITQNTDEIANLVTVTQLNDARLGRYIESDAAYQARITERQQNLTRGTIDAILKAAHAFEIQQLTLWMDITSVATTLYVYEDLDEIPIPTAGYLQIGSEVAAYSAIDTSSFPHAITLSSRGALSTTAASHSTGASITEYTDSGTEVESANLEETTGTASVTLHIDDGTSLGPGSYLVALVEARLQGDITARLPGVKGAGIDLTVQARALVSVIMSVQLQVLLGYDFEDVKARAETAIRDAIKRLRVGESVSVAVLAYEILQVEGVQNIVKITINGTDYSGTSSANVAVGANERARLFAVAVYA